MGNRVTILSDSLTIPIGGDLTNKQLYKSHPNRIKSTKYSLFTFLPQNLLEQFRRIANFYFLIMTIIAIVIDSPVTPLTSLIPLVFVIAVTATKQGYEDYLRHKADNIVNYSLVTVIRAGRELDIKCQSIVPGDLVKVARDCDVPCDLVLLQSSDPSGKCHVTTANLDGESNLKTLTVPRGLPHVTWERLHTLGHIECEHPITDLYSFNGRIELNPVIGRRISAAPDLNLEEETCLPLMAENLLLRGSRVKNTDSVIGCAVYTGQSTKLALNSKATKYKMSSSEKFINKFLLFFLILLITLVTISYFMKQYYDNFQSGHNLYLGEIQPNFQVSQFLQDYLSFLILYNYLIPISLYVTIEMHKFLGSLFLEWDIELYDEATNQPFIVNTSDLNEELGQVEILFSDKTGTLTKNIMIFQECSINGKKYVQKGTGLVEEGKQLPVKVPDFNNDVYGFFEALAVCHTVQVGGASAEMEAVTSETAQDPVTIVPTQTQEAIDMFNFSDISEEREDSLDMGLMMRQSNGFGEQNHKRGTMTEENNNGDLNPLLNRQQETDKGIRSIADDQTDNHSVLMNQQVQNIINASKIPVRPISIASSDIIENAHVKFINFQSQKSLTFGLPRPNSVDFKRTFSAEIPNDHNSHMTHRRTQSAAYPSTNKPTVHPHSVTVSRNSSKVSRQSSIRMMNSRESYAAPIYTENARVERNQSMHRKGIIEDVISDLDYQASSPDEKALVEACAKVGFIYTGDDNDIVTVKIKKTVFKRIKGPNSDTLDSVKKIFQADNSTVLNYTRLNVLEFTSDRKRMSVIVRDTKGQIWLYTKGAESYIFPLCDKTPRQLIHVTQKHVDEFARVGLRTLAVARRKLTTQEYVDFNNELTHANNSLTDRKVLVAECQQKIEKHLELLGATAVEDALQDDLKDTLVSIRRAGIKVWVLTGDKVETALNIAYSCGHIPDKSVKYFITECKDVAGIEEHLRTFERELNRNPHREFALLIDGPSLAMVLQCCPEEFRDLSIRCHAVLCCRLSPLQKCEVVQLMKTVEGEPITASIGDGANDVSMIQEADVGLGIVGKEGRQAARCADYAFTNFSMVKRLLLVHGHYFSQRLALLVLYFFYKNLVFMMVQLFFQSNSMFSSQSIYDSLFLTLYNVVYTALPVLFISITEKRYRERHLMDHPELYQKNVKNKLLQWKYFCGWMLLAVYHSVVIFYFSYAVWFTNPAILPTPQTVGFYCFGTFMIHNVVVLVNLKLWLVTVYQTYWFIFTIWLSILGFILTTFIYNLFNTNLFQGDLFQVYSTLLSSLSFWLLSILIIIAALIPDLLVKTIQSLDLHVRIFPGTGEPPPVRKVFRADSHRRTAPLFASTVTQPQSPQITSDAPTFVNINRETTSL